MEKFLSVSVASYNLGSMIEENIKSFCESSVANDIELIITDDGSKDNTPEIIQKYAAQFPDVIKFIKKGNEGPGSTVNSGIKNATGKYFRMVDGDDWVQTENMESYINLLKNTTADMIISDYATYDNQKGEIVGIQRANLIPGKLYNIDEIYKKIPLYMHALTFKTEILKANQILLDNCFYTDVEYNLFPMPFVHSVCYFDKTVYVYRVAQAGQSVNPNSMKRNFAQHDLVLSHLIDWYSKLTNLSVGQDFIISKRIAGMASTQLWVLMIFDTNKENKQRIKNFFKFIKATNKKLYSIFKRNKKCIILRFSGFALYGILSKYCKRRAGL